MNEQTLEIGPTCEAVLLDSRRITPDTTDEVRRLSLQVDEPAFRAVAGQSIGVLVPGPHPFGNAQHLRRYSVANEPRPTDTQGLELEILVRRCHYLDEVSGERYPGIASNYLCDASPGDRITLTGPYRSPFAIPQDSRTNLLMIGTGTGVAPFRGFIQQVYRSRPTWEGQVRLFYGARTGMDLLYGNEEGQDLANYYDEETFRAFRALISRPLAGEETALRDSLQQNAAETWELMQAPNTRVYLAGLGKIVETFGKVMTEAAGSADKWSATRQRLQENGRWAELIYG